MRALVLRKATEKTPLIFTIKCGAFCSARPQISVKEKWVDFNILVITGSEIFCCQKRTSAAQIFSLIQLVFTFIFRFYMTDSATVMVWLREEKQMYHV